jgi:hypothetical protein
MAPRAAQRAKPTERNSSGADEHHETLQRWAEMEISQVALALFWIRYLRFARGS